MLVNVVGVHDIIEIIVCKIWQNFNLIVGPIWFKEQIITCVKDEKYNLNIMTTTLKLVVSCEILGLKEFVFK
jgi:hypothetical protein